MAKAYNNETKAAVISALLAGQSIDQVATEYNVPRSTVGRWKNEPVPMDGTEKKEISELLMEYLRTNLETLRAQAVVFRDETWLKKNSAENLAVLHGVLTDKAIRLLEAMSRE